ncbi:MAG: glycosyltransferase [Rhodanobacteraceae bacterium]
MTELIAPLQRLDWDGCTLSVKVRPGRAVQLLLDGERFVSWPGSDSGHFRQTFGFAPGGRTRMQIRVACGEMPLHGPVAVQWGEPGIRDDAAPPQPLFLLDAHAEKYLSLDGTAGGRAPTVIIVPVFNAGAMVARCLAALREHTPAGVRLLLIDDGSTDTAIAPLLKMASAWPNVSVLRNEQNMGFTATVNRGLAECAIDADVVLLNADTEVGPGWLQGLRVAAWSRPEHASATAVSDNAGAFSVPELEQANPLPQRWSLTDAARALLQDAGHAYPDLPTGNGFCMYLRHDARAEVGALDAEAFPAGYGEENDWCQRAEQRGWLHVIAGNVLVGHARSQSFGEQRRHELGLAGMQVLRQRYPDYEAKVGARLFSFPRLVLDWRVRRLWRGAKAAPRPRVLLYSEDEADAWLGWVTWRLHHDGQSLRLLDGDRNERESSAAHRGLEAINLWLQRYGFEAVSGPADDGLASVCRRLGIPLAGRPEQIEWAFRA